MAPQPLDHQGRPPFTFLLKSVLVLTSFSFCFSVKFLISPSNLIKKPCERSILGGVSYSLSSL